MSLVKHNNNSISAVTSMANLSSGAMTLIKEITASSDSSISFVDGSNDVVLDSTYPIYRFEFINCHPQTDNVFLQFNGSIDSGSNYNVTKTSTYIRAYHNEADTSTTLEYDTARDLAQSTSYQDLAAGVGNGNDEQTSGYLYIFQPSSNTYVKHFIARFNSYVYTNYTIESYAAGYFNNTNDIDAVNFKFSSGNIDSGKIKLYGIKDS